MSLPGTTNISSSQKIATLSADKAQNTKKPSNVKDSMQSLASEAPATESQPTQSCGEKIAACFKAILTWIRDKLFCCFFSKKTSVTESESDAVSSETSSKKTAKKEESKASKSTKKEESNTSKADKKEESSKAGASKAQTEIAAFEKASSSIGYYFLNCEASAKDISTAIRTGNKAAIDKSVQEFVAAAKKSQKGITEQYSAFVTKLMAPALTFENVSRNPQSASSLLTNFRSQCNIIIKMKEAHALSDMIMAQKVSPEAAIEIFNGLKDTQKVYFGDQFNRGVNANSKVGVYGPKDFLGFLMHLDNPQVNSVVHNAMKQILKHRDSMIAKFLQTEVDALTAQPAYAQRS